MNQQDRDKIRAAAQRHGPLIWTYTDKIIALLDSADAQEATRGQTLGDCAYAIQQCRRAILATTLYAAADCAQRALDALERIEERLIGAALDAPQLTPAILAGLEAERANR